MTMSRAVFLLLWIMCQGSDKNESLDQCGGVLTATKGVIQTPNFPGRFSVPLQCRWVIDASHSQESIVVYFTQLFVSSGLSFTEYDYYEPSSPLQFGGRLIHKVTEQNVTSVQWLLTRRQYLVVDFTLDRLEGNHLRVLDSLLDVYGFNITYETRREVHNSTCSVVGCSLSGHCYASHNFSEYWCSCFEGFTGGDCGQGPLCHVPNFCENGGTCRQAGAAAAFCMCFEGFTGTKCEVPLEDSRCAEEDGCTIQCPEDGTNEPCACGQDVPTTKERARYEGTVRLTNVTAVRACLESATCPLKPTLTKHITKYLKNSNLTVMENLRVIDVGFSGEVRFHFWGGKQDGSRVRDSLNRLVQKGRLGNVSLVPTHLAVTQEPTLHLQSVRVNQLRPVVRQGDEFILSCFAQGSSHMVFRWFKDGVPINVTKARRGMWTRLLPLDSAEQYTALLAIEKAEAQDGGRYTCQVTDWGYQQCKSIVIDLLIPPVVKVDPITVTLEKGDNVTVKCTSPNELQFENRFGYSWTKNQALFKMTPGEEFWEDLYPGGSILRVNNVEKSVTYSCHVHGVVRSVSANVRLELLNHSVVPWCSEEGWWPRTGPGVVARVECPVHYSGVATRMCLLVDQDLSAWQTPDYSDCLSDKVAAISDSLYKMTLGYGNTTAVESLLGILEALRDSGADYPGEGEPVVSLLTRITDYLNETASWPELLNSTGFFFSAVNALLHQRNFIINHQKIEELHQVVAQWSLLWGGQSGTSTTHLAFDSLVIDMYRYDPGTLQHSVFVSLPRPTLSYPTWFTSKIIVHLEPLKKSKNVTTSFSVITYKKLTDFLPQRFTMTFENGSEVQYELASPLVSVRSRGPLLVTSEVELQWTPQPGWELRCMATNNPTISWNITACLSTMPTSNTTLCHCSELGIYSAAWVKIFNLTRSPARRASPRVVLLGCSCCLVLSLLTLILLTLRLWRHRTCLLFLKLQCCITTATSMSGFLYATSRSLPQEDYPLVSTFLQASVLVSISSHLSKVLLVYTEVVYLPSIKYLRQTIMCIITGVPLLAVMCNHIAVLTTDLTLDTWWLSHDSQALYTCLSCGALLVGAFLLMYVQVVRRLRAIKLSKITQTKKALFRRTSLLNRAVLVLCATVAMFGTSIAYVNTPTTKWQYIFSFSCALLGFVLLLCYVLHCESPLHLHLLSTIQLNSSFSSESDSSPLHIFTKQEAEQECDSMPTRIKETSLVADKTVPNGNTVPIKEAPPILKIRTEESTRTPSKQKAVTFHNDLVTGCDHGAVDLGVDMEEYPSSPRKYKPIEYNSSSRGLANLPPPPAEGVAYFLPPVPEGVAHFPPPAERLARVCVITSVVIDTPSVVVCSVDVEPYSVLNQSIVHAGVQEVNDPLPEPEVEDSDVMDRICHDLDYLLGGLSNELKPELPRTESAEESVSDSVQQTLL